MGEVGLEPPPNPSGNKGGASESGAKSGALRGDSDAKPAPAMPADPPSSDPHVAALIDALAGLPEADRKAVAEHVAALAKLSPGKRAAILTLTRADG